MASTRNAAYSPAVGSSPCETYIATYTTSTAIHTSQFSTHLRVAIHCAARLKAVVAPSVKGSAASVRCFRKRPTATATTVAAAPSPASQRRGVRETARRPWPTPPCSHSYQP